MPEADSGKTDRFGSCKPRDQRANRKVDDYLAARAVTCTLEDHHLCKCIPNALHDKQFLFFFFWSEPVFCSKGHDFIVRYLLYKPAVM